MKYFKIKKILKPHAAQNIKSKAPCCEFICVTGCIQKNAFSHGHPPPLALALSPPLLRR